MPYTNVPADKTAAMDSCVQKVMAEQGYEKERAIAICHSSVVEGMSLSDAMLKHHVSETALETGLDHRLTLADIQITKPDPTGKRWEVILIGPEAAESLITLEGVKYVKSKNNRLWAVPVLESSARMFEGAKVYDDHLTDEEFARRGGMRPPGRDWLGTITGVHFDRATNSLKGMYHAVDESFARKLLNASRAGEDVLKSIGLSIDVLRDFVKKRVGEQVYELVNKISKVISVDAVGDPAAGGRFIRALESARAQEVIDMDQIMQQAEQLRAATEASVLPDAIKAQILALLEQVKGGMQQAGPPAQPGAPPGAFETAAAQAMAQFRAIEAVVKAAGTKPVPAPTPTPDPMVEAQRILDEAKAESARIIGAAKMLQSQQALEAALSESGLPVPTQKIVRKQFAGRAFEAAELKTVIDDQREALLALDETGRVSGHGHRPLIQVGRVTEADRYMLDLMRLMLGNTRFNAFDLGLKDKSGREVYGAFKELGYTRALENWIADSKPPLPRSSRLSNWYYELTGGGNMADGDYLGAGEFSKRATEANLNTGTLASIVKNAVNIILVANYSVRQQWWDSIVEQEDVDTIDQATLVRVFGITTLPIVAEGDPYTELDMEDEEETATFFKRGGYVEVTLETFLRDKINILRAIPERLSNSWYNTVGGRVAATFTVNTAAGPVLADSGALFNSTAASSAGGHANLLTTALSHAAVVAVYTAMMKQTDQPLGAGERLGVENKPTHLLVPVDLRNVALEILNSDYVPGSGNLTNNQIKGDFEIVTVPNWTDATDWAAVSHPNGRSPINLIWLRGRRTPELFTADTEEAGAMFTNDALRYKVRKFMAEFSATYATAPVADWRGVHKSNVA